MLTEYGLRFFESGAYGRGHQIVFRHYVADRLLEIGFETEIAVGNDTYEFTFYADRYPAYAIFAHQLVSVGDQMIRREEKRIGYDAVLASFDAVDLRRLFVDGEIFVYYAQSAFARHGYGESVFGHGVHRCGHQRYVQRQLIGKFGRQVDVFGQYLGMLWY